MKKLSPREKEVANFLVKGLSMNEIANFMKITKSSVQAYCYRIMDKLGAYSHQDAINKLKRIENVFIIN